MNLNIRQANLSFPRTPTRRTVTNHIVIHHRAGTGDVASLRQVHVVNNGWSWVGYHFYIRLNGEVWQILPINTMGIHAREPRNSDSIAVCFEGNYETVHTTMPTAQYNAGVALLRHIRGQFAIPISGHSNHVATACPGRNFPLTRMRNEAMQLAPTPTPPTTGGANTGGWSVGDLNADVRVTSDTLNVRASRNATSRIVRTLRRGDVVRVRWILGIDDARTLGTPWGGIGDGFINMNHVERVATQRSHTVTASCTLWSISQKYGVQISEIQRINNLQTTIIRVGQQLLIP